MKQNQSPPVRQPSGVSPGALIVMIIIFGAGLAILLHYINSPKPESANVVFATEAVYSAKGGIIELRDLPSATYLVVKVENFGKSQAPEHSGWYEAVSTLRAASGREVKVRTYEADFSIPLPDQMWDVRRNSQGKVLIDRRPVPSETPTKPTTTSSRKRLVVFLLRSPHNFKSLFFYAKIYSS